MANLNDGSWYPIKGFEGYYWINREGDVCNLLGHILKPCCFNKVELRKNGQREVFSIDYLKEVTGI